MSSKIKDLKHKFLDSSDTNYVDSEGPVQRAAREKAERERAIVEAGGTIEDDDILDGMFLDDEYNKPRNSYGEKHRHKGKTAAAVAVAATIAAGGIAASEGNIDYEKIAPTTPIVQSIEDMYAQDDDDKKAPQEAQAQSTRGETIAKAIVAPLYAIGAFLLELFQNVATVVGMPILMIFAKWAILAAVILGSLALCFRLAFPDVPLKKILNKKCIGFVLVAVAVGSVVCEALPYFWEDAGMWIEVIRIAFGGFIIAPVFITVMKVYGKAKQKLKSVAA